MLIYEVICSIKELKKLYALNNNLSVAIDDSFMLITSHNPNIVKAKVYKGVYEIKTNPQHIYNHPNKIYFDIDFSFISLIPDVLNEKTVITNLKFTLTNNMVEVSIDDYKLVTPLLTYSSKPASELIDLCIIKEQDTTFNLQNLNWVTNVSQCREEDQVDFFKGFIFVSKGLTIYASSTTKLEKDFAVPYKFIKDIKTDKGNRLFIRNSKIVCVDTENLFTFCNIYRASSTNADFMTLLNARADFTFSFSLEKFKKFFGQSKGWTGRFNIIEETLDIVEGHNSLSLLVGDMDIKVHKGSKVDLDKAMALIHNLDLPFNILKAMAQVDTTNIVYNEYQILIILYNSKNSKVKNCITLPLNKVEEVY